MRNLLFALSAALTAGCFARPVEATELFAAQARAVTTATQPQTEARGPEVEGVGCAFTQGGWGQWCSGGNVGCLRDARFDDVYPHGLTVGAHTPLELRTSEAVRDFLPAGGGASRCPANAFMGQLTALRLNVDFSDHGVFGSASHLSEARIASGPHIGLTASEIVALAESLDPCVAHTSVLDAMTAINEGFGSCDPASLPPEEDTEPDVDGDGVPASADCDDADPNVGALLYAADFSSDDGTLVTTATLTDRWHFESNWVRTDGRGQQALLGTEVWAENTVTWAKVRADGATRRAAGSPATDRFRAGVLARADFSDEADEGFTGYRCAVARNIEGDCAAPGPFIQLAAFLPGPEDDVRSECEDTCVNPTFAQLRRVARSEVTRVLDGDQADLRFWAVGVDLRCEFTGVDGERVVAKAQDATFREGTTGLSVLNARASFSSVKVCEALDLPR
jgi:hypothetical protein